MTDEELNRRFHGLNVRVSKLSRTLKDSDQDSHHLDWLQAVGPIAIAIVGAIFTWLQFSTSERNQKAQAMAQLQAGREQADTSLRAEMFKALVGQFFTGTNQFQDKVGLLALFENNFQDFFSAGPLFDLVVQSSSNAPPGAVNEVIDLAKTIAGRQELLFAGTNQAASVILKVGQSTNLTAGDVHLFLKADDIDIEKQRVAVSVKPGPTQWPPFPDVSFHVSFFDMPLTDNTKLPGGPDVPGGYHRFAITLKALTAATNGTPASAQLNVVEIEHHFLTSVDRPSLEAFTRTSTEQASEDSGKHLWTFVVPFAVGVLVTCLVAVGIRRVFWRITRNGLADEA
jgi:hypothetical protein